MSKDGLFREKNSFRDCLLGKMNTFQTKTLKASPKNRQESPTACHLAEAFSLKKNKLVHCLDRIATADAEKIPPFPYTSALDAFGI